MQELASVMKKGRKFLIHAGIHAWCIFMEPYLIFDVEMSQIRYGRHVSWQSQIFTKWKVLTKTTNVSNQKNGQRKQPLPREFHWPKSSIHIFLIRDEKLVNTVYTQYVLDRIGVRVKSCQLLKPA